MTFDAETLTVTRVLKRKGVGGNPWRDNAYTKKIVNVEGEAWKTHAVACFPDGMTAFIDNLTCQQWTLFQGKAGKAGKLGKDAQSETTYYLAEHKISKNNVRVRIKPDVKPNFLVVIEESQYWSPSHLRKRQVQKRPI